MFSQTKYHAKFAATLLAIGLISSFGMTAVAGAMQTSASMLNVMGVTMPPWFYLVLVVIAVIFIAGGYQSLRFLVSLIAEGGSKNIKAHNAEIDNALAEQPTVIHPVFSDDAFEDSSVYDPNVALRR